MPASAQTTKLISTLRLLIPRLRLLQKKDTASSVHQRRELAHLLEEGRDASARIRVENVIATDIAVEVMEMVELYCELLLARANVLDQIAFGEKGAQARNRAKEALKAEMAASSSPSHNTAPAKEGSRLGFSFWGGATKPKSAPARVSESDAAAAADADGDEDSDENALLRNAYLDTALDEAAAAVFYAWPRFPHEVRELTMLRTMLVDRYGKEFMTLAQDNKADVKVPERLVKGLRVRPPAQELVESYLREIAKAYGVSWPKEDYAGDEGDERARVAAEELLHSLPPADEDDTAPNVLPSTPQKRREEEYVSRPDLTEMRRASEADELSKATPPREMAPGRSPVSVAPPGPRTDNPNPRVKLPGPTGSESVGGPRARKSSTGNNNNNNNNNGIPELDELTKRFAALRR